MTPLSLNRNASSPVRFLFAHTVTDPRREYQPPSQQVPPDGYPAL